MALQTINLGGKDRPIRYSHKALRMLSAKMGAKSFQDLGQKVTDIGIEDVPFLAYVGLKEGARYVGEIFETTEATVAEWLDDESAGIFQVVMLAFSNDFSGEQVVEGEKKATAKVGK